MGFKSFITNGWNKIKSGIHQGLLGAKNVVHKVWDTTKKGLIGAKNFVVDHPQLVGTLLHAVTPFATAFNPMLGALTSTGASFFNNMPKGPVKNKLKRISEQVTQGEFTPPPVSEPIPTQIGGASTAQAAVESRRAASKHARKWTPFRGV